MIMVNRNSSIRHMSRTTALNKTGLMLIPRPILSFMIFGLSSTKEPDPIIRSRESKLSYVWLFEYVPFLPSNKASALLYDQRSQNKLSFLNHTYWFRRVIWKLSTAFVRYKDIAQLALAWVALVNVAFQTINPEPVTAVTYSLVRERNKRDQSH